MIEKYTLKIQLVYDVEIEEHEDWGTNRERIKEFGKEVISRPLLGSSGAYESFCLNEELGKVISIAPKKRKNK